MHLIYPLTFLIHNNTVFIQKKKKKTMVRKKTNNTIENWKDIKFVCLIEKIKE